ISTYGGTTSNILEQSTSVCSASRVSLLNIVYGRPSFSHQSGSLKNRDWRWLTDRPSTLKVLARFRLQIHYCNCDIEVALCSTLLLFKCTKTPPARSSGRSGPQAVSPDVLPLARIALAPRSCPFPVSSTVAVVNTPLPQRNVHYTTSPGVKANPASTASL